MFLITRCRLFLAKNRAIGLLEYEIGIHRRWNRDVRLIFVDDRLAVDNRMVSSAAGSRVYYGSGRFGIWHRRLLKILRLQDCESVAVIGERIGTRPTVESR